jgi:hypothetical protein
LPAISPAVFYILHLTFFGIVALKSEKLPLSNSIFQCRAIGCAYGGLTPTKKDFERAPL